MPDLDRIAWKERIAVIAFDSNATTNVDVQAGRNALARDLSARGAKVLLASLPQEDGVNGPDDYIVAHGGGALLALIEHAAEYRENDAKGPKGSKDSAATKLICLVERCELFHDAMGDAYATVRVNDHRETMRVTSRSFRRYLSFEFFKSETKAPSPQALASALPTIEAKAIFDGSLREIYVRVGDHAGELWLDLCNQTWEAVRITGHGWQVVQNPPLKFVRHPGMSPLPRPAKGGSLRELEAFTTLRGDALILLEGFLLGCLRKRGPFPILALIGEQGSGKTTTTRVIKRLIDPSRAAVRCLPRDERDLMIAAESNHVLALDNLSFIDERLADALCRLATGGGLSTRTLYTDRDETIFEAQRPVILNSITDVVTRPDVLDRAIVLPVPAIEEASRRPEGQFWAAFEESHPLILGALCDAASLALRNDAPAAVPAVRMADFALWVAKGERALGLKAGSFVVAYEANRREANECAVDCSVVAQAVKRFLEAGTKWNGTAGELLEVLSPLVSDDARRSREWPKTPRGLGGAVRRLVPNLRCIGIHVNLDGREAGTGRRLIEFERTRQQSQSSRPSQQQVTVGGESTENKTDTEVDGDVTVVTVTSDLGSWCDGSKSEAQADLFSDEVQL